MANLPFEYRIINPLERPKAEDLNIAQGQAHGDTRLLARELFDTQDGFLGDGFLLSVSPAFPVVAVRTSSGVFFQSKSAEYAIGGVPGLNDELAYKVGYIGSLDVGCQPVPTGTNEKRYDLLQVRALTGTERLTNEETVDILNPALQSFIPSPNLAKTLTASFSSGILEGQYPVYTANSESVTGAMSYVSGEVTVTADWNLVPKPTPAAGYLPVGYIKRYAGQTTIAAGDIEDARPLLSLSNSVLGTVPVTKGGTGQTSLSSGEILLGNGTNSITSTAVLPVSKGGTGNSAAATYSGSVAWFDTVEGNIKYTQAQLGLPTFAPQSGWLLSSNATGAPNWIEPGAAGQVLVSTGTAWEAGTIASQQTVYTASGTHNIPASVNFIEITCIGGGGGGGGGARSDTGGEVGSGGGGGGGGGITRVLYRADDVRALGSTLDIIVGEGGAGGLGATAPDTSGTAGSAGAFSRVLVTGNQLARANGGSGGSGGYPNSTFATGGAGGSGTIEAGTAGGTGTMSGAIADSDTSSFGAATGGGAGGGYDGTIRIGGDSGTSGFLTCFTPGVSGGGFAGGVDGNVEAFGLGASGGSGGGAGSSISGGNGGAGGAAGGGGGGGGYCRKPNSDPAASGGNGGNGGNGRVIIREW